MSGSLGSSWHLQRFLANCIVGSGLPSLTPMGLALRSRTSSSSSKSGSCYSSASLLRRKTPGDSFSASTARSFRIYTSARLFLSRSVIILGSRQSSCVRSSNRSAMEPPSTGLAAKAAPQARIGEGLEQKRFSASGPGPRGRAPIGDPQ